MRRTFTLYFYIAVILVSATSIGHTQGAIFGIAGGPSLSNQRVNGFQREPFLRYHGMVFIESSSDISPNALYARLGYHVKGSAVNFRQSYDEFGNEYPARSYGMEFRNASLSIGVKQRRELGRLHYSYGFGIRGDYNIKADFGQIFSGLEGAQNKFTYGVNIDVGIEYPMSELISTYFEIGFSPDLIEQIFIPIQDTGYNDQNGNPIFIPESKLTNLVFEARLGFRFWRKVIYTD